MRAGRIAIRQFALRGLAVLRDSCSAHATQCMGPDEMYFASRSPNRVDFRVALGGKTLGFWMSADNVLSRAEALVFELMDQWLVAPQKWLRRMSEKGRLSAIPFCERESHGIAMTKSSFGNWLCWLAAKRCTNRSCSVGFSTSNPMRSPRTACNPLRISGMPPYFSQKRRFFRAISCVVYVLVC